MSIFIKKIFAFSIFLVSITCFQIQANSSSQITVINPIVVPAGKESKALEIWDKYAEYFSKQPGYIKTNLHKSLDPEAKFHYINVAVWESPDDFIRALNSDELKKMGEGFPKDMPHYPSMYQVIRE